LFPLHAYVPMRNNTNDYADSTLRPDLIIVHPSMLKVENRYHPDTTTQKQTTTISSLPTCQTNIRPKTMAQQSWNMWNDRARPRSITTQLDLGLGASKIEFKMKYRQLSRISSKQE
jgi:hypothetical protein